MREAIKEAADKNGRSMNAEIISRLELSFLREVDRAFGVSTEAHIDEVMKGIAELNGMVRQLLDRKAGDSDERS